MPRPAGRIVIGRMGRNGCMGHIVRAADFERVLATPIRARSAHFAVHYLFSCPSRPVRPRPHPVTGKLSTGHAPEEGASVDDSLPEGSWLGVVVPKRHARRSVTRTLIKRQIRSAAASASAGLAHGLWVVRLRSPFDKTAFPSASSDELKALAGHELVAMFADAAHRVAPAR